jgi:hypothetical protein
MRRLIACGESNLNAPAAVEASGPRPFVESHR